MTTTPFQMAHDFLSESADESRVLLSSVVRIKFWNPNTQVELTDADPSSGMMVTLVASETTGVYKVRCTFKIKSRKI